MLFSTLLPLFAGVVLVLFFASLAHAPQPLVLEAELERSSLGLYSDILEDPSGQLSLEDVLTPEVSTQFFPATSENPFP